APPPLAGPGDSQSNNTGPIVRAVRVTASVPPGFAPQPPPLAFLRVYVFAVRPARSFGSVGMTGCADCELCRAGNPPRAAGYGRLPKGPGERRTPCPRRPVSSTRRSDATPGATPSPSTVASGTRTRCTAAPTGTGC